MAVMVSASCYLSYANYSAYWIFKCEIMVLNCIYCQVKHDNPQLEINSRKNYNFQDSKSRRRPAAAAASRPTQAWRRASGTGPTWRARSGTLPQTASNISSRTGPRTVTARRAGQCTSLSSAWPSSATSGQRANTSTNSPWWSFLRVQTSVPWVKMTVHLYLLITRGAEC